MFKHLRQIWLMTGAVYDDGFNATCRRAWLVLAWMSRPSQAAAALSGSETSSFARLFRERADMIGILAWPYQCASWGPTTRLDRLRAHCRIVDTIGPPFN